jgi:rod shape-determining protein MreC
VKIKKYLTFSALILYIAVIYFSPPQYINKPKYLFLQALRFPLNITRNLFKEISFLAQAKGMINENIILRDTVAALTHHISQQKELEQENERLRVLLEFKEKSGLELVPASIIAKDSSSFSDTIVINQGRLKGLKKDSIVMSEAGLVGRIYEASTDMSRVMLITDINSRISAIISRSRQIGIVYGMHSGMCKLKYLPFDSDIEIGDKIVTSGFSDVYPKGILIGTVTGVIKEPRGLSVSAMIKPSVDFTRLEEVMCVK